MAFVPKLLKTDRDAEVSADYVFQGALITTDFRPEMFSISNGWTPGPAYKVMVVYDDDGEVGGWIPVYPPG